ncbi:MAG: hypothetical protein ACHQ7N_16795 [Candidatus Methylomirabilales bacterium]
MGIPDHATPEGTDRFRRRFAAKVAESHFRRYHDLRVSSIGLGTYLGDADDRTDRQSREAVARAAELGSNVLDSAINENMVTATVAPARPDDVHSVARRHG